MESAAWSRHRNTYKSFETLAHDLSRLRVKDAILDGEIICLDSDFFQEFDRKNLFAGDAPAISTRHSASQNRQRTV
jgi:hypothetical protein